MIVSIIIPVFNTLYDDLLKCINSIISQTFSDFEIILVDDGSDSEHRAALDDLTTVDSRIKIFHKSNEGVSVARNFGVSKSLGKYIMFVDADDLLTPWLLESGVSAIEKENCDVIIGKIKTTGCRPDKFPVRGENVAFELVDSVSKKEELECHIFAKTCTRWQCDSDGWEFNGEGCWAHLLKREVAQSIRFIPGVSVGEDTIWALSMLNAPNHYRIGMLSEPWYYYIQNDYSVLNKYNPRIVEQLTVPVEILEKKYGSGTGKVYNAYTDWLLMKLKQICYRAYLAEENADSIRKKAVDLSIVLHNAPWRAVLSRGNRQPLKKRIKFLLYEKNVMLYLYVVVRKYRNGKRNIKAGVSNENKN